MTLIDYLRTNGLTYTAFAGEVGVSVEAVRRYARGKRLPRPAIMERIVEATDGAVTVQDFYNHAPDGKAA